MLFQHSGTKNYRMRFMCMKSINKIRKKLTARKVNKKINLNINEQKNHETILKNNTKARRHRP